MSPPSPQAAQGGEDGQGDASHCLGMSPPTSPRPPLSPHQICWGCKHTLELMASGDTLFGSYYAHEPGGSPSWLFQVRVKVWLNPSMRGRHKPWFAGEAHLASYEPGGSTRRLARTTTLPPLAILAFLNPKP